MTFPRDWDTQVDRPAAVPREDARGTTPRPGRCPKVRSRIDPLDRVYRFCGVGRAAQIHAMSAASMITGANTLRMVSS